MRQVRRLDLIWQGDEVETYEKIRAKAESLEKEIPAFVKEIIEKNVLAKKTKR